jgi:hypothetical protein
VTRSVSANIDQNVAKTTCGQNKYTTFAVEKCGSKRWAILVIFYKLPNQKMA